MSGKRSAKTEHPRQAELERLLAELTAIRTEMVQEAVKAQALLDNIDPRFRASARNLLHYLVLRRRDLRPLQTRLAELGLSSLGRAESHVLAAIDAVLDTLHRLTGAIPPTTAGEPESVGFSQGTELLVDHTNCQFGPPPPDRWVRIMVTMPSVAAEDYGLIHALLQHGMDCMRINCAHDDEAAWLKMIEHLRRAEQALGRSCRVVMDLGGPKLRTGGIRAGQAVLRIRPRRDRYGRVVEPARVWLDARSAPCPPPVPAAACLAVPDAWLARLRLGHHVHFIDASESRRVMTVSETTDHGCLAELHKTAHIVAATILRYKTGQDDDTWHEASIGDLPPGERAIILQKGDLLIVTRTTDEGHPTVHDSVGNVLTPATIGSTIPEVFNDVREGEPVWFDDGKLGGIIERIDQDHVDVRITHARPGGDTLRPDKGINLPESRLALSSLTARDIDDLRFVSRHADVVELSFANSARDVEELQRHLETIGGRQPAVVLKIETRRGFENLPDMLLTAMQFSCCGVMIARGDLAVECGFDRLAEVQEEILWICEAAHVPVIWATQVLETLARKGIPSRAEITDAAMSHRAECVMLNKGPNVVTALQLLDDILRRMQAHQDKKRSMLRALHLAHTLTEQQ